MVPAAGGGTRLDEVTRGRPKPLLHVGGRTLIEGVLACLGDGVSDVCIVVPPDDPRIPDALGSRHAGKRLHFAVQEEPLGVGHAVLQARARVSGPFLVAMADAFFSRSLDGFVRAWRASGAAGAVLVESPESASSSLMGRVHARDGSVASVKKSHPDPRYEWRVAGAFLLPAAAFDALGAAEAGETGEIELETGVTRLLAQGYTFAAVPLEGWRTNVNRPEDVDRILSRLDGAPAGNGAR